MTAAAAVGPTELEELMEAQAEAAHEREVGDATRPTAEDLATSPTRIDVEGLDLFYGDHHALKDVSIKIRDKQITSFIGPSGCGKSTLLRCFNRMNDGIKGCRIEGKVKNSVLFRDVVIEKGAEVNNCIIMEGGRILTEASLRHVITDRNVIIRDGRTMMGHENYPITIAKNATV